MGKDLKGKELGTGISQRSDGYYIARYTSKYGRRISKLSKKLQECKLWLANAQLTDTYSNPDISGSISVNAWYQYWIDMKKCTVSSETYNSYVRSYKKHIKPVIGGKKIADINTMDCQIVMNKMAKKNYKSSTIKCVRMVLSNLLDYAYQNNVIIKNPCTKLVKSSIGEDSIPKKPLSIEDQKLFLRSIIGSLYEYVFRFVLQTGLRTGELIALRWSDIDLDKGTLTVKRTAHYHKETGWTFGKTKTKAGNRVIPLTNEAKNILMLQKEKNEDLNIIGMEWRDIVFLTKKGTPSKNILYDSALKTVCKRAGINRISMHILRHTFATRCVEAGMSPKTLQTLMGHSKIEITMNLYVHSTDEQRSKEMHNISDALMAI